jgi:hypothetical protein
VTVVIFSPGVIIDTIVGMKKHDQTSLFNGRPDEIEHAVIQTITYTPSAYNDALEMRILGYLCYSLQESIDANVWDERKKSESVQTSQRSTRDRGG